MKPCSHDSQQMPSYRETFRGIHFNHPPQKVLTVRGDKMWHVEHSTFHLLQQLPQVVVIERQGTLHGCDRVVDGKDEQKGIGESKRRKG